MTYKNGDRVITSSQPFITYEAMPNTNFAQKLNEVYMCFHLVAHVKKCGKFLSRVFIKKFNYCSFLLEVNLRTKHLKLYFVDSAEN